MSPDLYFLFTLAIKMAVTAGFVIAATVIAERAGPLIGALIVTLPISAGPAYVFVALDHDAQFVARAALASVLNNVPTVLYTVGFVLLAQRFRRAGERRRGTCGLVLLRASFSIRCRGRCCPRSS